MSSPFPSHRLVLDDPTDAALAATLLGGGAAVAHGFANFYAITARGDAATVARVNELKGRPPGQVGSITAPPDAVLGPFDLGALPACLTRGRVAAVVDAFMRLGPIGFRGPAADHVPDHLASWADGVRTTQVIVPGRACPSNRFLALAAAAAGPVPLFVTSANRSRHLTGTAEEPAHWQVDALRREFDGAHGLAILEHADERWARHRFPRHAPMSTTILGLHRATLVDGVVHVPVERHGSLELSRVRWTLASLGMRMAVESSATERLRPRVYATPPPVRAGALAH